MRELTLLAKRKLAWRDKPDPKIKHPKEALIRPFVASRCDGDSIFLFHNFTKAVQLGVSLHFLDPTILSVFGKKPFAPPFCVGHECIGEVVETGEEVTQFRRGQVVIVPWAISCGTCATCSNGYYAGCKNTGDNKMISAYGWGEGTGDWGGSVCDVLRVPFADEMLVEVPGDVNPYHCSSLADNISDAYRTVAPQLEKNPAAPVLIMGGVAKSIGVYAASLAVCLGSSRVDYVDYDTKRLELAQSVGANAIQIGKKESLKKLSGTLLCDGYPIAVDASGNVEKLNFAIRNLSLGGIITATPFYFRSGTPLPLWEMYAKSASFHTGPSHPRRDIPAILPLIQKGIFKPEKVTTLTADWEQAPQAYLEETTKVVLVRNRIFSR
jgi:threonine dehydrogenase-like Zn-dependent dehydrogenase